MRYRWFICFFMLTVSAGLPASAQELGQKWQQIYDAGITAADAGDYAKAEKKLREALAIARKFGDADSRHAESVSDLGVVLFLQQRDDEARPFLERGLALHKTTIGIHKKTSNAAYWMGDFYLTVGEYEKAVEALQYSVDVSRKAAVPEDDGTIVVLRTLGIALIYAGRSAEAVEPLRHVVEFRNASPNTPRSEVAQSSDWYGAALYSAGRYREAAEQYQRAVDIWKTSDGDDRIAYTLGQLGNAHDKLGNDLEAEAAYQDEVEFSARIYGETSEELLGALRHLWAFYTSRNRLTAVPHIEGRIAKITGEPAPGQTPVAKQNNQPSAAAGGNALAESGNSGNAGDGNALPDPYDEIPAILYRKATVGTGCDRSGQPATMSDNEHQGTLFLAWAEIALEKEAKDLQAAYDLYAEALYTGLKCTRAGRDAVPGVMMRIAIVAMHLDRKNEAETTSTFAIQFADIQFKNDPPERRGIYELFAELHRALGNEALANEAEAFAAKIGK
jgi:tetratricopeptide (TPR) repeat protein